MAVYSDLSIDQGSDFSADIVVEDASGTVGNLSGFTVAGQIRKTYTSTTATNFTIDGIIPIVIERGERGNSLI